MFRDWGRELACLADAATFGQACTQLKRSNRDGIPGR